MATKLQTPTPAKGVQFRLNANTFLRTGYTFNGWSTNYASSISEFADNAYVTFDGDRDLYALWKANNYQVKFNANGGTGSMGNQTFTYDQGQYLAANAFIRTGHDFNKWTANADGSGNQYGNGVWVSNLTATAGGIVNLYAQWDIKQYTAIFNANGGTGGTSKTQDYDTALTAPTVSRTGYSLQSWNPTVPARMPASNNTYVAQWLINQYTATFVHNDGTQNKTMKTQDYNTSLSAPSLSRTGYTLSSWSPTVPSKMPASNNTYTAQWSINQYTATFVHNDGTGNTTQKTQDYGTALTAPTLTRTGYTFANWNPTVPSTMPAANNTYTAQWNINTYNLTIVCDTHVTKVYYKLQGDSSWSETTSQTTISVPQGKVFEGYSVSESGYTPYYPESNHYTKTIVADYTVIFRATECAYIITEDGDPIITESDDNIIIE